MSDTQNTTPEGSGELTVEGAANAFLGLMGGEEGSDGQPELQAEANESEAESDDESEVEQDEDVEEAEEPQKFRVKAAGEEREVTLEAEERKAVEAERQAVQEAKALRDQYAQRLEMMEQMLKPQDETENLAYLKETDPIGYSVKVAEMVERDKQLNAVRAERERIAQQQEHERQQNLQRYVAEESQKLVAAVPEFADPAKGETLRKNIREFGKSLGFSDQELASVYDSRAVLTLYKAMQYDKLVASKPEITKKVAQAPKVIKAGVSQPRDSNAEELKKLKARARESGRVADAASVFEKFI
ncbi:hypothetical protein EBT31_08780 [bacterium]|nr:hypothetical protein [bacterium]